MDELKTLINPLVSKNVLTVAELKRNIVNWPETDAMGEPTEVWVQTGRGLSGPCVRIEPLNFRKFDDKSFCSDLLFCPSAEA